MATTKRRTKVVGSRSTPQSGRKTKGALTGVSIKRHLKPHRVMGRWTTFNGALQAALAVPEHFDEGKLARALKILGQEPDAALSCVYCGEPAATWDHLENNVKKGHFSGFGNRIFNLVPACRTCNERKGGKAWRVFLTSLDVPDKTARTRALARFARQDSSERFGWTEIKKHFPSLATEYVALRDRIKRQLLKADRLAEKLRTLVVKRIEPGAKRPNRAKVRSRVRRPRRPRSGVKVV